jgi:hypothetical protein
MDRNGRPTSIKMLVANVAASLEVISDSGTTNGFLADGPNVNYMIAE